uniref:Macaca fascicularis brain cDNA clone: QflA-16410, similar to human phospholipase C, beta 1 (phosphoinositide-specific)(PLCB1), transcript variant 2, mRNA, RefSeq: NM_182734.1 n=1 Tax=Macaca fascicularis TaxID=9541 RepID=I7G507_MACFA|nr:unnamed protein product [Macaca fascicularis]
MVLAMYTNFQSSNDMPCVFGFLHFILKFEYHHTLINTPVVDKLSLNNSKKRAIACITLNLMLRLCTVLILFVMDWTL